MLRQDEAQIEALNKELESLSYSISHDLGAPVRAVSSYAMIFEELYGAVLDDEGRRLLAVMRSESARMGDMIDGLLQLSALGRQPMQIVNANMTELAQASANEFLLRERGGGAGISIETLPTARGDAGLLRRVWDALLSNAIKYSGKRSDAKVSVTGAIEGGEVCYHVADNGVGFNGDNAERTFGAFQQLHRPDEFPGVGLGLTIVRRIIARHGGRTWANASVGEGATFSFALPSESADG